MRLETEFSLITIHKETFGYFIKVGSNATEK